MESAWQTDPVMALAVKRAWEKCGEKDYHGARQTLADVLDAWMRSEEFSMFERWSVEHPVALELMADLSLLLGRPAECDCLLKLIAGYHLAKDRPFGYKYVTLKRAHAALAGRRRRDAMEYLIDCSLWPGTIQDIPTEDAELAAWEDLLDCGTTSPARRVVLYVWLYLSLGKLLACEGRFGAAGAILRRGLHHAEQSDAREAVQAVRPSLRLALAAALLEYGSLDEASAVLAGGDDIIGPASPAGTEHRYLELRGQLAMLRGELGTGLECYTHLFQACLERRFDADVVAAGCTLGYALIAVNRLPEARRHLLELCDYAESMGDTDGRKRIDTMLAIVDLRASPAGGASPVIRATKGGKNAEEKTRPPSFELPAASSVLNGFEEGVNLLYADLSRGGWDMVALRVADIRRDYSHTDSRLIRAGLEMIDGVLLLGGAIRGSGDTLTAIAGGEVLLESAGKIFEEARAVPLQWECLRYRIACLRLEPDRSRDLDALVPVAQFLLDQLTDSLPPAFRGTYLLNKWSVEEESLALLVTSMEYLQRERIAAPLWRRPFLRWREMRGTYHLLRHIEAHRGHLLRRAVTGDAGSGDRSNSLGRLIRFLLSHHPRRATITCLVLPDRVLSICASWLRLDLRLCATTALGVRHRMEELHRSAGGIIAARSIVVPKHDLHVQHKLVTTRLKEFDAVTRTIAPLIADELEIPSILASLPKRIRSLAFVPDDALHGLPFAALIVDGRYLAEQYAVSIAFTSMPMSRRRYTRRKPRVLLVGVGCDLPDVNDLPEKSGQPKVLGLPNVVKELNLIREILETSNLPADMLRDMKARPVATSVGLARAAMAHVMCHGTFDSGKPARSGLILPGTREGEASLTIRDLWGLRFPDLRHVTLCSCWMGDNFAHPARVIISFPQILDKAGVGSSLASLWPVEGEFSYAIMKRFYRYLEREPRDAALRHLQLDCIQGHVRTAEEWDRSSPYFWAGLQMYGDPRHLDILRKRRLRRIMRMLYDRMMRRPERVPDVRSQVPGETSDDESDQGHTAQRGTP